ncbi:GNAT family N-acetyltransferase [Mycetocola saprophilus]|uniref:GNAT family N-acetyltransferase n=1 Tax=Mycetocola saprophilus TaxID=76636 RepID=UPI0004C15209|nr:GNAT family N-acetyltransferase [Mycetocola saprophilus]
MTTYVFSTDPARVDRDRVHAWLRDESYWAQDRSREAQETAMDASRNYGIYEEETGRQVAYARVVTDGATFGWVCDVFVDSDTRGEGLGKMLMAAVIEDLEPLGLRRLILTTATAQGLYEQYGFTHFADPTRVMVRGAGDTSGA